MGQERGHEAGDMRRMENAFDIQERRERIRVVRSPYRIASLSAGEAIDRPSAIDLFWPIPKAEIEQRIKGQKLRDGTYLFIKGATRIYVIISLGKLELEYYPSSVHQLEEVPRISIFRYQGEQYLP